ncbi:MAG: RHS repeat-associated core domain-containing protein, partial [Luteolibacter sp.]
MDCGCCECYDLEDLELKAGGTSISSNSSETVEVSPDEEGQISLSLDLPEPSEECDDCDETSLKVMVTDSQGKQQEGTAALNASEWESPITVTIECTRSGSEYDAVCKTYYFSFKSCEECTTDCSADSGGSGTSQPSGDMPSGDGDSVELNIPVGKSGFGESSGNLKLRLDSDANPGRSALKLGGWDGIPKTGDAGGLLSVTTKSSYAKVETTATANDPNAFTVSISHDPANPASTVFRTVLFEKEADGTLKATIDAFLKTRVMTWKKVGSTWTFTDGNGLRKVEKTILSEGLSERSERRKEYERDPDNSSFYLLVSDVIREYELHGGAWVITKERIDPDNLNLVSTWEYYERGEMTGPSSYIGVSRLKNHDRYDGYYERHNYYTDVGARIHMVETPYAAGTMVKTTSWKPSTGTLSIVRKYNGSTQLSRTDVIYEIGKQTRRVYTNNSNYLTTITEFWLPGYTGKGGRVKKITRPDGTISTYDYVKSGGGSSETLTITEETGQASGGVVVEGTRTVTKINTDAATKEFETSSISQGDNDGVIVEHWVVTDWDSYGRPETTSWFPTFSSSWDIDRTYACCGLASETDKFGNLTQYQYDDLGRRIRTNRLDVTEAVKHQGLTVSRHRYAETVSGGVFGTGFSNEISRTVTNVPRTITETWGPSPQSGALEKLSTRTTTYRNPLGTLVNLGSNIGSKVVNEAIQVANDGSVVPKQSELVYFCGKSYRTWGDLGPAVQTLHYASSTGPYTITCFLQGISTSGTGGSGREYSYDFRDHAGRPYRQYQGGSMNTYFYYNSLGQLNRTVDADGVNTRYAYNSKGERVVTANKLNGTTGSITWGTDRITSTETFPAFREVNSVDIDVLRTVTKVWKDGDTSSTGGTVVSVIDRTTDGLMSWTWQLGVANDSVTTTTLAGGGDWTVETVHPDGSKTLETYIDGLWDKTEQKVSSNVISSVAARKADNSRGYDTLKRPTHSKESRTATSGVTVTQYRSVISDAVMKVIPPAGAAQATEYAYDHRGRRIEVDAPQSEDADEVELDNITVTSYYPDGRVKQVSGHQAYPVSYTYDYAGRMKTMTTTGDAGNSITAWNYSTSNGLLLSKRYNSNSTGTTGSGPDYTYTSAGRLQTRQWARKVDPEDELSPRVTTTYGYTRGLLTSVTYNDNTPGVTYNYDAFPSDNNHIPGDIETVTRGGVTWTHQYDPATLRLKSETHPVGGTSLTRVLTRHFDTSGRDDGFELGTDADPDLDHAVDYGHDTAGRLNEVVGAGQTFTYGYVTGSSHLIHTVNGPADTLVTNTWDPEREVLEIKKNEVDSATVSQFTYAVNDFGQRTGVITAGSAFGNTDRGWEWGYDYLGQAVKAVNSYDSDYNRAYVFDIIGNRTSAIDGDGEEAVTTGYTPNKLNQYTAIDPGTEVYPVHDPDGNLLEDAGVNAMAYGLKYEWDAENRIVAVRKADDTLLATYDYDHLGRRIRTTTTAAAYQGASDIGYLYDGWNVVAEYTIASGPSIALHQAYTWGLDLSGTLQGAGGVGGLLCIHRGPGLDISGNRTWSDIFMPFFDGNGNIVEYIKGNGDEAAHFEYDPFGRLVDFTELTLNLAATFTYRFSTKPQGFESGLYYYGYRYYDPVTGRWPSRDPIEEEGGLNLYGFLG